MSDLAYRDRKDERRFPASKSKEIKMEIECGGEVIVRHNVHEARHLGVQPTDP